MDHNLAVGWAGVRGKEPGPEPFLDNQAAVWVNGGRRFFTPLEWQILCLLRDHTPSLLSLDRIEGAVFATRIDDWPSGNGVVVHICRIRKKLRDTGYHIRTAKGFGWAFERDA